MSSNGASDHFARACHWPRYAVELCASSMGASSTGHLLVARAMQSTCTRGVLFSIHAFKNTGTSVHFTVMFAGLSVSCSLVLQEKRLNWTTSLAWLGSALRDDQRANRQPNKAACGAGLTRVAIGRPRNVLTMHWVTFERRPKGGLFVVSTNERLPPSSPHRGKPAIVLTDGNLPAGFQRNNHQFI